MQRSKYPGYEAVVWSIYAKSIDSDFFLFYPEDVDPIAKKINAHIYKDGQWIRELRDYPDVIDNDSGFMRTPLGKQMLTHIAYTHIAVGGKPQMIARLESDPLLRKYVIPSVVLNNSRDAVTYIDKMAAPIILKPAYGNQGRGVMRVERLSDGNYELIEDHNKKVLTTPELDALLKSVIPQKYIAQKYIRSHLSSGIPFDVRLHLRRDKTTQWHIVKMYARAGLSKALTSNLAGGGGMADAKPFLRSHLGREIGDRVYRRLEEIGKSVPERLQHFYAHNIDSLGIDVGLDADGSIYFFEINGAPGTKGLRLEDAICAVDYAKTLALNPDLAFPEL